MNLSTLQIIIIILVGVLIIVGISVVYHRTMEKNRNKIMQYFLIKFRTGIVNDDLTFQCCFGSDFKDIAQKAVDAYAKKTNSAFDHHGHINRIAQISKKEYTMIRTRLLCKLYAGQDHE